MWLIHLLLLGRIPSERGTLGWMVMRKDLLEIKHFGRLLYIRCVFKCRNTCISPLWDYFQSSFMGFSADLTCLGAFSRGSRSPGTFRIAQLIHTRASAPLRVQPAPYPAPPLMQHLGTTWQDFLWRFLFGGESWCLLLFWGQISLDVHQKMHEEQEDFGVNQQP